MNAMLKRTFLHKNGRLRRSGLRSAGTDDDKSTAMFQVRFDSAPGRTCERRHFSGAEEIDLDEECMP